jgi:hypothetical protein
VATERTEREVEEHAGAELASRLTAMALEAYLGSASPKATSAKPVRCELDVSLPHGSAEVAEPAGHGFASRAGRLVSTLWYSCARS